MSNKCCLALIRLLRVLWIRKDLLNLDVRSWNYVSVEQFADSLSCSCASIYGSLASAYVASYHNGNESAAYKVLTDQVYVSSLYHSICCFDGSDQSFGFDHS